MNTNNTPTKETRNSKLRTKQTGSYGIDKTTKVLRIGTDGTTLDSDMVLAEDGKYLPNEILIELEPNQWVTLDEILQGYCANQLIKDTTSC